MIVTILEGVAKRLKEDFPEMRVYVNEVEQGLNPPCFMVTVLEPSRARLVGPGWRQERTAMSRTPSAAHCSIRWKPLPCRTGNCAVPACGLKLWTEYCTFL